MFRVVILIVLAFIASVRSIPTAVQVDNNNVEVEAISAEAPSSSAESLPLIPNNNNEIFEAESLRKKKKKKQQCAEAEAKCDVDSDCCSKTCHEFNHGKECGDAVSGGEDPFFPNLS